MVMFGAVAASGINILAGIRLDRRALLIIAVSLALGLGVSQVPEILSHLPRAGRAMLESGVATGGICALVMNWFLPENRRARAGRHNRPAPYRYRQGLLPASRRCSCPEPPPDNFSQAAYNRGLRFSRSRLSGISPGMVPKHLATPTRSRPSCPSGEIGRRRGLKIGTSTYGCLGSASANPHQARIYEEPGFRSKARFSSQEPT